MFWLVPAQLPALAKPLSKTPRLSATVSIRCDCCSISVSLSAVVPQADSYLLCSLSSTEKLSWIRNWDALLYQSQLFRKHGTDGGFLIRIYKKEHDQCLSGHPCKKVRELCPFLGQLMNEPLSYYIRPKRWYVRDPRRLYLLEVEGNGRLRFRSLYGNQEARQSKLDRNKHFGRANPLATILRRIYLSSSQSRQEVFPKKTQVKCCALGRLVIRTCNQN